MAEKKTVRVRLLQVAAGPTWAGSPGDVVWLPEEAAGQFVEGGWGELVEEAAGVEAQMEGVVEVTGPDATSGPMVPASAAEELAVATTAERAERAVAGRKRASGPAAPKAAPARKEPEAKKPE